jgi:hypothetical protein
MSIVIQAQRVFGACAVLLTAAGVLSACSDDESESVTLTLLTPEDGQVLTAADDTDADEPGVQLDVTGKSTGLRAETPIELFINGDAEGVTGDVDDEGNVTLSGVTLPPGENTIYLRTAVGSVQSDDEHAYTLRALVIELPEDGDVIGEMDDANPSMDGIQITVRTQSFAIEADGDVSLRVDDQEVATATPDAEGTATFEDITLADGEHTLQARVGSGDELVASDRVEIEIVEGEDPPAPSCEGVELLAPSAPGTGAIVLGGNDCDDDDHVTTDVRIAIEDGEMAQLQLNGDTVGEAVAIEDGMVTFEDVELSDASGNSLVLIVDGDACQVTSRDIQLDCSVPRCVIRAPEPVDYEGTLYLNASHLSGEGFNIEVESDDQADGELIGLVIDGDEADALTATAGDVGGDIVALFEGVELSDGEHTISASCRDANGNIATTPTVEITVDTTPCGVDITAPMAGFVFVPGDDTTASVDGVQVGGIAGVTGSDCVAARSGLCQPDGELSGDFAAFDGSTPHTSLFTLEQGVTGQQYCVEIRDRAGNVGGDDVAFMYRQVAPMVLIESPVTGTSFNSAGGGAFVADALPETPLCDAEIVVACEVGTMVELHRGTADGALIASGECEADDDAPTGYTGRAAIMAVVSDALGDNSATIVATQTFVGGSDELAGVSAPVTYANDCEAPVLLETQTPCTLHASHQITLDEADDFVVLLGDMSADTVSASLEYWTGTAAEMDPLGTPTGMATGTVTAGNAISFAPIDFGDEGPLAVAAELVDDVGNVTTYLCDDSAIVDDLPAITVVTWPADGADYGPGDSECDPPGDDTYGITIAVTLDQAANRAATLSVNGTVVDPAVLITGNAINLCVGVPDNSENTPAGPSTIRLDVTTTFGGPGTDFIERELDVRTIEITDPVEDQLIVSADDCDPGAGFGYLVSVDVDPMHDGEAYTIVADDDESTGTVDGTTIEACVAVTVGGERTFTASIDGTPIEHSVTVNVVNDTPMIVSIGEPGDGDDFGVGDQTCAAAGIGTYGVNVIATVDQASNREAELRVNGGAAIPVTIGAGGAIDACVNVPDNQINLGPTTITLNLRAVLGAGTDTESVEINVDTLDIVDPVEDQMITAVDDCDMTAGFGYLVELAVDESHLGRTYSITDGVNAASTGVIMDDLITACVAITPSASVTLTASIMGTPITESVTVDVEDAPPAIVMVTAPANNAMFGPGGQTCATAGSGNYGVRVQATMDQSANRIALVSVNGGTAVTTPITGTTIDACVAVPDNLVNGGPSTITVRLEEESGSRFDTETVTVNVDKLNITSPTVNQAIVPADDCDPGVGFGFAVSIAVDPSLAGAAYTVDGGGTDLTGAVAGATITGCLPVTSATTAIVASITGTPITETVPVTVFTGGPPTTAISFTRACPATISASYREDPATLTWGDLGAFENYEGQFATLQMRCAHTGLAMGQSGDAWWTAATAITLPGTVTVASTSMSLPFRVGEARFCAVRAANAAMELSPVGTPTEVTCGFRSTLLFAGTMGTSTAIGIWNAALGDVSGDGLDDAIAGGSGRAHLFLGSSTGFTGTPNVTFTSTTGLGIRVAGLGDINGDGRNDFAISHGSFGGGAGQVFVFFGRPSTSPWPAAVDLSVACGADLCLKHGATDARLGNSLTGIGDFDNDGRMDIAIGAFTPSVDVSRLFIVLGGAYETRSCAVPADCLATETCGGTNTCVKLPATTFWGLDFELPTGNWTNPPSGPAQARLEGFVLESNAANPTLARGIAALGAFDSTAGDDIIVQSAGNATEPAKLYFLSGRDDPAGVGIAPLTFADLGFRTAGVPSGTPFETTARDTGNIMFGAGNILNVTGAPNPGAADLLVKHTTEHQFYIYPGDTNFAPASRVRMAGPTNSNLGISLTRGVHSALPPNAAYPTPSMIGDLDGDGRPEFAAGTAGLVGTPGQVYLWYADSLDSGIVAGVQSATTGSFIEPPASAGTQQRIVQFAGDMTGDGNPDLVVGNWQANSLLGEVYLLY